MSNEKSLLEAINRLSKIAEQFRLDYVQAKSKEQLAGILDPNKQIADAMQKIALDLSLFRIKYESECTMRGIRENMPDTKWLDDFEKNDEKVQSNINSWRDYLQKYSLVLMAISGFFISLITFLKPVDLSPIMFGFILLGVAIGIIFITIFGTLFLQRKIIDGNFAFGLWCKKPYTEHTEETNYSDAVRRNLKEHLDKLRQQLSLENDPKKKRDLKRMITADGKALNDMKYTGGTYLFFEQIRNFVTGIILVISFWGIAQVSYSLLTLNDVKKPQEQNENISPTVDNVQESPLDPLVEPHQTEEILENQNNTDQQAD